MKISNPLRGRVTAWCLALLFLSGLLDGALAQTQPLPSTPTAAAADTAPAEANSPGARTADAAPAALQAPTRHESIENPYGISALWQQGDFVAKGTLIIMILMSMGSWYIIFTKLWEQRRMLRNARQAEAFWKAGDVRTGLATLPEGTAFRFLADQSIQAAGHHEGTLVEKIDLHTWIGLSVERAVTNIQSRLQDGLSFLATVGSTAPFVGLFGTVWGIYHALTAIGISGQASIDKVAGPVGEALIMTAFGLGVAVPAVMGYNWLIRRNKGVMEKVRAFSGELHNVLLTGKA
jgi:biopolymer transport protein ExbB